MTKTFHINSFAGGMNDWIHPSMVPLGTAVNLSNADISNGKLVPEKGYVKVDIESLEEYGHYGTRDRNTVKWNERTYWSNNTAYEAPYYGGDAENYLGIPYPRYSGTDPNVEVIRSSGTGFAGKFKYCVCFVNPNGWEGAPGSLEEYETEVIRTAGESIGIRVTWSDAKISYAKVYRTGDHGADFYCIGEIRSSGGTLTDNITDEELVMLNPLNTEYNYPPPDGGKYLSEYGGVFFLGVGSLLYFSVQGNPHAWPTTQFISMNDTITGIVAEFQGVLVFTRNNVYRITGADDPATITKSFIPGNHGCINFRSIACLNNAPIWLSNDGLCLWDGNSINILNYQRVHVDTDIRYAVSANDKYYLFYKNSALVFDRQNGDVFRKLEYGCNYAWYDDLTDILYLEIGSNFYRYGKGNELTVKYLSPHIGETELGYKIFRELLISSSDGCVVNVWSDGDLKVKDLHITGGRKRIKLPFESMGRYLQIGIEGKSEINEYAVIYE